MSFPAYTHHSRYALDGHRLLEAGTRFFNRIQELYGDKRVLIAYTGLSGVSLGTAILIKFATEQMPIASAYVRKENEVSHGLPVEFFIPGEWIGDSKSIDVIIVVDDFIESGNTALRIKEDLISEMSIGLEHSINFYPINLHEVTWVLMTEEPSRSALTVSQDEADRGFSKLDSEFDLIENGTGDYPPLLSAF